MWKANQDKPRTPKVKMEVQRIDTTQGKVPVVKKWEPDYKKNKKKVAWESQFVPQNVSAIREIGSMKSNFETKYPVKWIRESFALEQQGESLLKTKTWRPSKFYTGIVEDIYNFFNDTQWERILTEQSVTSNWVFTMQKRTVWVIPTFERFWLYVWIHDNTLRKWSVAVNDDWSFKYPEFRDAYMRCKKLQENFLKQATSSGLIKESFGKFLLNVNHDMVEQTAESQDISKKVEDLQKDIKDLPYDQLQEKIQWSIMWEKSE